MATVSSTLQINDRFTGPLKSMLASLKGVKASTTGVNSALQQTGGAAKSMNAALNQKNQMAQELQRTQKMALLAGKAFREAKRAADSMSTSKGHSSQDILRAQQNAERMRSTFVKAKGDVNSLKAAINGVGSGSGMAQAGSSAQKLGANARTAKGDMTVLKSSMDPMPTGGIKNASSEVKNLGNEASKAGSIFKSVLGGSLVGSALKQATGVITGSLGRAVNRIDTLNNSQKVFKNLGISAKESADGMKMLDGAIDGLPTSLNTAVTGVQSFVASNGDMKHSIKLYKAINDAVLGFGGSVEQSESAVTQLSKAFASGKIQGEAFNALTENNAFVLDELAAKMGMTQGELRAMGTAGEIDVKKFQDALIELNEKGGKNMASTAQMAKDATAGIGTAFKVAYTAVDRSVAAIIEQFGPQLAEFFQGVKKVLNGLKPEFVAFGNMVSEALNIAVVAIQKFMPVIKAIAPVAGIFLAASGGTLAFSRSVGALSKAFNILTGNKLLTFLFLAGAGAIYAYQNFKWFKDMVDETAKFLEKAFNKISEQIKEQKKAWSNFGDLDLGRQMAMVLGYGAVIAALGFVVFKVAQKFNPFKKSVQTAADAAEKMARVSELGAKGLYKLQSGLGALAKMTGIALVVASLALLAFAMKDIASTGPRGAMAMLGFGAAVGLMALTLGVAGQRLNQSKFGILAFGAAVAIMALAMAPLAQTGAEGAIAMLGFGAAVGIMAITLGLMGPMLQSSIWGILAFGAAVGIMALAMAPIAQTGTEGAIAMLGFGLAIGIIALALGLLGPLLTAGALGILAFGAAVAMAGWGIGQMAPAIAALPPVIDALGLAFSRVAMAIGMAVSMIVDSVSGLVQQIGDSITQIVDAIGNNLVNILEQAGNSISQVFDSIGGVIESVGNSIRTVLDGIAGIIEQVGNSAVKAGEGFKLLAEGVDMIMQHGILSLGGHLTAVAGGLGAIASQAGGLNSAGQGMQLLAAGITMATAQSSNLVSGMQRVAEAASAAKASVEQMKASFSNIQIPNIDTSGFVSSMTSMTNAARTAVAGIVSAFSSGNGQMRSAGMTLGRGGADGVRNGITSGTPGAVGAMRSMINNIQAAGRSGIGQMRSIGAMIGQGLAAGMNSALGAVTAAANNLVAQAERAARAKAKIHSPSRLMRDQVGRYIGEGMAVGMDNTAGLIAKSAHGLVDSAVNTVSGTGLTSNSDAPSQGISSAYSNGFGSTQSSDNHTTFNLAQGAVVIQSAEGESGESLLAKLEDAIRDKYDAGLAY